MNANHLLTLTFSAGATTLSAFQANAESRPNVLFIAVDDMKPLLGCYGDKFAITPNMDAMARKGTTFLNNQCQYPVCGPSRTSLMTGLRPEATGVMNFQSKMRKKNPNIITLPQQFKNNGYVTVARGKVNDPRCVAGGHKTDDPPSWSLPYSAGSHKKKKKGKSGKKLKLVMKALDVPDNETGDGSICEAGISLIKKLANKDKPFFIAVGFHKPHLPFIAPKKYWDMYDENKIKTELYQKKPKGVNTIYNFHDSPELRGYTGVPKKGPIPPELQKKLIHGYYACVTFVDALIGKLIAELQKEGVADNTIICIWGDHGWHLGDHGMWGKHTALEQASRSPLIIVAPGYKGGQKTMSPTEFIDVYPTLCDLAGIPKPPHLQGKSLVPILKNPNAMVKPGAVTSYRHKAFGYSFRTKRYRYVEWVNQKSGKVLSRELYDYQKDPRETIDFSKNPEYAEIMKKLAKELRETCKNNGARILFKKK